MIINFIKEHFSGYTLALILFSSYLLLFIDRAQLKRKKLIKEARFSAIAGVTFIVIACTAFAISVFSF